MRLTLTNRRTWQHLGAFKFQSSLYNFNRLKSGREVRLASRRATYWREHGRRGPLASSSAQPSILLGVPSLPPELTALALRPLPESAHLFQEALRGPDRVDESDLGVWKNGPPYTINCAETASAPELYFTERLVEVVHGVRLREQREMDEVRRLEFSQGNLERALGHLAVQVTDMVVQWNRWKLFLDDYSAGPREMTMAQLYLQWHARTTYHLYNLLFL